MTTAAIEPLWQSELKRLHKVNAGLRPNEVVAAARDPKSPLHTHFEWDDSAAAEQHRLQQARQLIASVKVIFVTPEKKTIKVRAFTSVPDKSTSTGRSYQETAEIVSDADKLAFALAEMERDVIRLSKKWASHKAHFDLLLGKYLAGSYGPMDEVPPGAV